MKHEGKELSTPDYWALTNKLKEDKTVNISFELVIEIEDGNPPGIYFDESFVSFLNRIGASIDVDLYVL